MDQKKKNRTCALRACVRYKARKAYSRLSRYGIPGIILINFCLIRIILMLNLNDGATVGGGEREEHRVGAGGRSEKHREAARERLRGRDAPGNEEDKETQLTTPP